jgi:serine/threonine protein kinase
LSVETVGGRYEVERMLGRGGMATVYLARDDALQRPVALKVLADGLRDDDPFRCRSASSASDESWYGGRPVSSS